MVNKRKISRKKFLQSTAAGVMGAGLLGISFPAVAKENKPSRIVLGKTGLKVTPLCFGASRAQQPAIIHAALGRGINFLDTGRQYAHGRNEELIGKVLRDYPDDVVVQSKVKVDVAAKGRELATKKMGGIIRDKMQKSLEESLKALGRDQIDIWLCHGPEREDILFHEEVIRFFDEAKRQRLIRSHGFSAHSNQAPFLKRANQMQFYDVIMLGYNHKGSMVHSLSGIYRKFDNPAMETEMEKAHKRGVGIMAMKTCSGGPYSPAAGIEPSFPHAVKWALDKPFVDAAAVVMANYDELAQHAALLLE